MKVELKLNADGNGTAVVTREPGDPRFRRGGFGAFAESQFLYHVKRALQAQGYDVLKKRMAKDGHMVDDLQQYVRERKARDGRQLAIWNGSWALYDAGERFNEDGRVSLLVTNLARP